MCTTPKRNLPYVFERTFHCGHPSEFIQVELSETGGLQHTLLPRLKNNITPDNDTYKLTFSLWRCKRCAVERGQAQQPNRGLAANQGEAQKSRHARKDGFIEALNRHAYKDDAVFWQWEDVKLHARMQESEHQNHEPVVWNSDELFYERAVRVPESRVLQRRSKGLGDGPASGSLHREAMRSSPSSGAMQGGREALRRSGGTMHSAPEAWRNSAGTVYDARATRSSGGTVHSTRGAVGSSKESSQGFGGTTWTADLMKELPGLPDEGR